MRVPETTRIAFDSLLGPVLAGLNFSEIQLKDCMRPQFLFRNGRVWFSLSWDWRDQYLDVNLGHLFWFRDVMPRVVVVGDFSHWDASITWDAIGPDADMENVFGRISNALPGAFSRFEGEYARILEEFRTSRSKYADIDSFLGKEADDKSLEKYTT